MDITTPPSKHSPSSEDKAGVFVSESSSNAKGGKERGGRLQPRCIIHTAPITNFCLECLVPCCEKCIHCYKHNTIPLTLMGNLALPESVVRELLAKKRPELKAVIAKLKEKITYYYEVVSTEKMVVEENSEFSASGKSLLDTDRNELSRLRKIIWDLVQMAETNEDTVPNVMKKIEEEASASLDLITTDIIRSNIVLFTKWCSGHHETPSKKLSNLFRPVMKEHLHYLQVSRAAKEEIAEKQFNLDDAAGKTELAVYYHRFYSIHRSLIRQTLRCNFEESQDMACLILGLVRESIMGLLPIMSPINVTEPSKYCLFSNAEELINVKLLKALPNTKRAAGEVGTEYLDTPYMGKSHGVTRVIVNGDGIAVALLGESIIVHNLITSETKIIVNKRMLNLQYGAFLEGNIIIGGDEYLFMSSSSFFSLNVLDEGLPYKKKKFKCLIPVHGSDRVAYVMSEESIMLYNFISEGAVELEKVTQSHDYITETKNGYYGVDCVVVSGVGSDPIVGLYSGAELVAKQKIVLNQPKDPKLICCRHPFVLEFEKGKPSGIVFVTRSLLFGMNGKFVSTIINGVNSKMSGTMICKDIIVWYDGTNGVMAMSRIEVNCKKLS